MVEEILQQYKNSIETLTIHPSQGGVLIVKLDGKTIYSKKDEQNRFPEPGEIALRIATHRKS